MLITDTGVPERFIDTDDWGGEVMLRLDDGWCAALDRNSDDVHHLRKTPADLPGVRDGRTGMHRRTPGDCDGVSLKALA